MIATISPAAMVTSTPRRASMLVRRDSRYVLRRFVASIRFIVRSLYS
jgi:hypothetical protein